MDFRKFELILHSATDLPDVRELGRMKVYSKVSFSTHSQTEFVTPVDKQGEKSPFWNCKIISYLTEEAIHKETTKVSIKLYCQRLFGDRYIGEVNINLKRLFEYSHPSEILCFEIDRFDCVGTFGKLNLSYKFGEKEVLDLEKPSRLGKILKEGAQILLSLGVEVVVHILTQG
ncbi:hypothetical protein M9H77_04391 [Catharanthus roseus]|uniref:Uncharacterized protein n=1 Tax=Catharanthus roseus TaxID=4058 RepID=A0ACC0CED8_CATRO|nr:hypothetical protein M9H77_04391 [Catharanthus roseus]